MNTLLSLLRVCFWSWAFKTMSLFFLRFFNYTTGRQCLVLSLSLATSAACSINPFLLAKARQDAQATRSPVQGCLQGASALLTISEVLVSFCAPQQHRSSRPLPAQLLCLWKLWWSFSPCRVGTRWHSWSHHLPDHPLPAALCGGYFHHLLTFLV